MIAALIMFTLATTTPQDDPHSWLVVQRGMAGVALQGGSIGIVCANKDVPKCEFIAGEDTVLLRCWCEGDKNAR